MVFLITHGTKVLFSKFSLVWGIMLLIIQDWNDPFPPYSLNTQPYPVFDLTFKRQNGLTRIDTLKSGCHLDLKHLKKIFKLK